METPDQNRLLTRVSRGTPMGELLRRYWMAFAVASDLDNRWTKRVRLLGEDLLLFRDRQGRLGLIAEHCPHRRASLAFGIPTVDGIRCPYHGWEFDACGTCLDQPNEKDNPVFRGRVRTDAYPVAELGGLLFAYMGPEPRPLLPRYDGFVVDGAIRIVGRAVLPVNWLQIMENSADPVHTEWLHGHHYEFIKEAEGVKVTISAHHEKIDFREFDWGITKHRLLTGGSEQSDDWKVGHPIVFPHMLAVGIGDEHLRSYNFQIRVPMDDEHTLHIWYHAYTPPPGAVVPPHLLGKLHVHDVPIKDSDGEYIVDYLDGEDIMAWISQGPIADRSKENLGASDSGVVMYRRMLKREAAKVANGEDPKGVIRDPARNERIDLPSEKKKHHFADGFASFVLRTQIRYSKVASELVDVFEPESAHAKPRLSPTVK